MSVQGYHDSALPTCIIHIKPTVTNNDESSPLFIWIPGNPGLLEYYQEFLAKVHDKNPTWEILGISHAGTVIESSQLKKFRKNPLPIYDLKQQTQHKIDIINKINNDPNRELVIMGHSVGAYIAQHVVSSPDLVGRVSKLGLITPTIRDIHKSSHGLIFTRVFNYISNVNEYLSFISSNIFNKLIPAYWTKLLISFAMGCSFDEYHIILGTFLLLTQQETLRQVLGLAAHEMLEIRDDWAFQEKLLTKCKDNGTKLWLLFSDNDHWVSQHTQAELIKFLKDRYPEQLLRVDVDKDIKHSFVVKDVDLVTRRYF